MGVTGASSEPVAKALRDRYFCILPTSTVYCAGQKYLGKADELRQIEAFLQAQGVKRLALVVASFIGADLALAFLAQTALAVGHVYFDGGQFAQIKKAVRRSMTPLLYLAIKSLYWSGGRTLKKSSGATATPSGRISSPQERRCATATCAASLRTAWRTGRLCLCRRRCKKTSASRSAARRSITNTAAP